ncbi:MAG: hypothetical protein A2731_00810 [Candidatus Buchananbacteria bacterium RIFCSPHIGHO2_01_FULL_39_8]|uniref:Uncharacterized protein n=1 Tax=Candidatus Buchananbacteria bacterium RIFCSPHIGHO2_01_FULL_39_8 TaxID=1797533 RepID=A0A1G1Y019_9BACT|nr:MAG: hypothetical protein A2731_00810 [Candidatus Buchananbacteria bacterium RIFCSPHIGHO2_01_FULL_39_8]
MDISSLVYIILYFGAGVGLLVFIFKIGKLPIHPMHQQPGWPWDPPDEHHTYLTLVLMLLVPGFMAQHFGPEVGFVTFVCWPLWLIYLLIAGLTVEVVRFIKRICLRAYTAIRLG